MKFTSSVLVSALLASLLLTACGEKTEEAAPAAAPTTEAAPAAAAPEAAPAAPVAGGYEPTAEERVPGITLTAEELAGSAPAEAAPAEAAPAEAPAEGS